MMTMDLNLPKLPRGYYWEIESRSFMGYNLKLKRKMLFGLIRTVLYSEPIKFAMNGAWHLIPDLNHSHWIDLTATRMLADFYTENPEYR